MTIDGTRVLIVEDEFLIRLTLAEALADDGFSVIEAESGEEALAWLKRGEDVALLLTDVQLPGALDGRALAKAARLMRPDLPVIFTSGRHDTETTGARDLFIAKPYLPSDVLSAARRLTTV